MPTLTQSKPLRYASFFYLYLMQGLPSGFALTALTNYLIGQGMTAQGVASFGAVIGLPWGVKFVWGPLVDRFQGSAMGQRRPWVLLSQLLAFLASLGLLFIPVPTADLTGLMAVFVLHGIFASLQDVSVDALAITVVPAPERGRVNALMKAGMVTGQAMGAAGLALLLKQGGFHQAATVQALVLLVLFIVTCFIRERPQDAWFSRRYRHQAEDGVAQPAFLSLLAQLSRALLAPSSLLLFGGIALVFIGERLFQRVYTLALIQQLGWSDTAVSVLSGTYGTLLALSLALIGGWFSDRIGALRMVRGIAVLMAGLHLAFSLAAPWWGNLTLATTGLLIRQSLEPVFSIAALPVLMGVCRPAVAGAQFAFYMALSNQADVLGIYLSGYLLRYYTAGQIGVGCGLAMLVAVVMLLLALRQPAHASLLRQKPASS